MRMTRRIPHTLVLWIGMILLLCALAPDAVAGTLQGTVPEICGAAVVLGLALLGTPNGDPK